MPTSNFPFPGHDEDMQLMVALAEAHSPRYKSEVDIFLEKGELKVTHGNFTLWYQRDGIGCRVSLSSDSQISYRELSESRLVGDYAKDRDSLFWEFAHSEARLILEEQATLSTSD